MFSNNILQKNGSFLLQSKLQFLICYDSTVQHLSFTDIKGRAYYQVLGIFIRGSFCFCASNNNDTSLVMK